MKLEHMGITFRSKQHLFLNSLRDYLDKGCVHILSYFFICIEQTKNQSRYTALN